MSLVYYQRLFLCFILDKPSNKNELTFNKRGSNEQTQP